MKQRIVCAFLLTCGMAVSQEQTGRPAFEVASIKPAEPSATNQIQMARSVDAGRARFTNFSLKDYIRTAYRVKDFQVQGPDWMENTRFNIEGKLPEGASTEQIPEMLQSLLADRFKLTLHRDTKEHAIYALVAGKNGPKLKPAETPAGDAAPAGGRGGRGPMRAGGMMMQVDDSGMHLKASTNLTNLAEMISRFSERPVVDQSGIQGDYEFDLAFTPDVSRGGRGPRGGDGGGPAGPAGMASDGPGSIYDSVQRYGLKLEPRKAPMMILTVDSIEMTPTEN